MADEQLPPPDTVRAELDSGAILKAMRQALGLSQERFAELVGMKRQQVSAYENGHHSAGVLTLSEIASRAGIEVEVTVRRKGAAARARAR